MSLVKESKWFQKLKTERSDFAKTLPKVSRRSEYWKKSNLDILSADKFLLDESKGIYAENNYLKEPSLFYKEYKLIDVNEQNTKKTNFDLFDFKSVIADEDSVFKKLLGKIEQRSQKLISRPLAIENIVNASTGLVIRVEGSTAEPLFLHNQNVKEKREDYMRNLIVLEDGASLTVVETGNNISKNILTEFYLKKGAKLNFIDLTGINNIRPKINHRFCELQDDAEFKYFSVSLNPRVSRSEFEIHMDGARSSTSISNICYMNKEDNSNDENILINHNAQDCVSRQVFKSVLDADCTSIVRGKIFVDAKAQKTDGYQSSRSLLLNNKAKFHCKPELEIYADDVACSHGSTSGGQDQETLFYLLSRGVSKREAEDILVMAFITEALEEIESEDLKESVQEYIGKWIKASSDAL
jgi:Fe-S cluster assembly protein SufD